MMITRALPKALNILMVQALGCGIGVLCAGLATAAADDAPAVQPQPAADGGNATAMTDIHDIKPVLALSDGLSWQAWALIAAALLGVLALAWWLWKRRKPPEITASAAVSLSPEQEACQSLDALATDTGVTPKQFYFRLSAVIRLYMERRFDFPAAEMTTEELLPWVDRLGLKLSLAHELKTFCRRSDPVKFADAPVESGRLPRDLAFARDLVRQTTAAAAPPDGEEAPGAPSGSRQPVDNRIDVYDV